MTTRRQLLRQLQEARILLAEFAELAQPILDGMGPTDAERIRLKLAVETARERICLS